MKVSGEYMEDHELTGVKSSCIHCPVTCGRDVEVEGKGRVKGPEYETLALLGPNLEIGDLKKVSEWNYHADGPPAWTPSAWGRSSLSRWSFARSDMLDVAARTSGSPVASPR